MTSSGWIGKERLKKWEISIEELADVKKGIKWAQNLDNSIKSRLNRIIFNGRNLTVFMIFFGLAITGAIVVQAWDNLPTVFVSIIVVVMSIVCLIQFIWVGIFVSSRYVGYILLLPIWLLMAPYKLIHRMESESVLERTLALVGILLGMIGIFIM